MSTKIAKKCDIYGMYQLSRASHKIMVTKMISKVVPTWMPRGKGTLRICLKYQTSGYSNRARLIKSEVQVWYLLSRGKPPVPN